MNVPEVKYARNGAVSIAYQVVGEGPQDVTFVTGFVGHLELFCEAARVRRFFERLSSFSRLIPEFITGVRPEHEPERVLATVLFTDIVSSTERAAATGDREWREILERHDELVRTELVRFRGREIHADW